MELKRLNEHIWYMPYEGERDRPNLVYVKGDKLSLTVDAGHSASHTHEFYTLLKKENLSLPDLTVITHWHWDHSFGMHAVNGLCIANAKTNQYLKNWKNKIEAEGPDEFFSIHESIRKEYEGNRNVIVKTSDIVFSGEMVLNLGGCTVKIMQAEAPHTDDSTLIYVCEDKVLFIGDASCPEFMTGKKDYDLCLKLAEKIRSVNPKICVEGHWEPVEPEDTLSDLLSL